MTGPNRGSGIYNVAFVDPESTFGTAATQYPVAADALRITGGSANVKRPRQAREDAFGTASRVGSIDLKETGEWTLEFYLYTPGTAATQPDYHDLFVNACGLQAQAAVADTTVSGSGSTTTVVDVTDASNFTDEKSFVTINGETRRITAVDTASTPDNITVSPPLSAAPSNTDTVTSALSYYPDDDTDAQPNGCTIWLANNAHMWRLTGCKATSVSCDFPGNGAARCTVSGSCREGRLLYTTSINEGGTFSAGDTTLTVTNGEAIPDDVSATNTYYIQIEDEILIVTAKSGNDLTVTRGALSTSDVNHADGLDVIPYQPAGTYAGSPVPSTGGHDYLAGTLTRVESFGLEIDTGAQPRENVHGASYTMHDWVQGRRTVTPTLEAWSENETHMLRVFDAFNRTSNEVFSQQGSATGSIIAVALPTVKLEVPDFAFAEGEMRLTFTGEAEGTSAGEDEVYIAFG